MPCEVENTCAFCYSLCKVTQIPNNIPIEITPAILTKSLTLFAHFYDTYDEYLKIDLKRNECYNLDQKEKEIGKENPHHHKEIPLKEGPHNKERHKF
jgi:hypothetical protein